MRSGGPLTRLALVSLVGATACVSALGDEPSPRVPLVSHDGHPEFVYRFDEPATVVGDADTWQDYQIIQWQPRTTEQYRALRAIGITAGMIEYHSGLPPGRAATGQIEALRVNRLRWYVENIATDFYAPYHRWAKGRPVNWRFQRIKRRYERRAQDPTTRVRVPSLSDSEWLRRIRERVRRTVRAFDADAPLFYNLADEPGIADLSVSWDFDFSPPSLSAFRIWLRRRYRTLAALNQQWGTNFAEWRDVVAITTGAAMARSDDNFSAWGDFKEWMDEAFARALRSGTDAVHAASKRGRAAIEGAQVPGWGGYDYSRLVRSVDLMELYDGGGNLEIVRSLDPGMIVLTTSTAGAPDEVPRIWRELLRGARGVILWDPQGKILGPPLPPSTRALARAAQEIRAGLGALLIGSERVNDAIAILYSPASLRTQWLLDWRAKGDEWARRDISASYEDPSVVRSSMMGFAGLLESRGWHPRILSPELLASGALERGRYRILFLPHAIALSKAETDAIEAFVAAGGAVVADGEPGAFDEHGRRLPQPALGDLFHGAPLGAEASGAGRSDDVAILVAGVDACEDIPQSATCIARGTEVAELLAARGMKPQIEIRDSRGRSIHDVSTYLFRNGHVRIMGIQRDGATRSDRSEHDSDANLELRLPEPVIVCDLRSRVRAGPTREITVVLRSSEVQLLAFSPTGLPRLTVAAPNAAHAGETVGFRIDLAGEADDGRDIVHVEVVPPEGSGSPALGRNLLVTKEGALLRVPFPRNAASGNWRMRFTDLLGCTTSEIALQLKGPRRNDP